MEQNLNQISPPPSEDKFMKRPAAYDLLKAIAPDSEIVKKYDEWRDAKMSANGKHKSAPAEELPPLRPIDFESFYNLFKQGFAFFRGKNFEENENNFEARKFVRTLCAWFLGKKMFENSPLLSPKSRPNINKGLLIVGNYGVGKSAVLRTFQDIFRQTFEKSVLVKDIDGKAQHLGRYGIYFNFFSYKELISEFEKCSAAEEKDFFWTKHGKGVKCYDDLLREREASNYGKIDLIPEILTSRYDNGVKTIIILNYTGAGLGDTLDDFAKRYGNHLYDRVFEMFNILELKGKSLRK